MYISKKLKSLKLSIFISFVDCLFSTAPQVIRKIRSETFADASGHLKLWCQFFNILSDCTLKWYKNEMEIAQMKRR